MALEKRMLEFTHGEVLLALERAAQNAPGGEVTLMRELVSPVRSRLFDAQFPVERILSMIGKHNAACKRRAQEYLVRSVLGDGVRYALGGCSVVGEQKTNGDGTPTRDERGWMIEVIVQHEVKI